MKDGMHPGFIGRGDDELVEHEGATWLRVRSRTSPPASLARLRGLRRPTRACTSRRARGGSRRAPSLSIDGKPVGTGTDRASLPTRRARAPARAPDARSRRPRADAALHGRAALGRRAAARRSTGCTWHRRHGRALRRAHARRRPRRRDDGRTLAALHLAARAGLRPVRRLDPGQCHARGLAGDGGRGDADVEARLVRDRHPPVVLGTATSPAAARRGRRGRCRSRGSTATARSRRFELVVKRATKGTRVLLGDPRVVVAGARARPPPPPPVRGASSSSSSGSTPAKSLAPWGGPHAAPELSALAASGHHVPREPRLELPRELRRRVDPHRPSRARHGLDDPDARLPDGADHRRGGVPRRAASSRAMFTANPTTGAAFGFDRGWDTFIAHDPLEDAPATRVFDDAAAWIDAHKSGPLPRRGPRARRPSAVGRDARRAEDDAARRLLRDDRAPPRRRGAREGAQAPRALQGGRPRARLGALRSRHRRARRRARPPARRAPHRGPRRRHRRHRHLRRRGERGPARALRRAGDARRAAPRDAARHPLARTRRRSPRGASTRRPVPSISPAPSSTRSACAPPGGLPGRGPRRPRRAVRWLPEQRPLLADARGRFSVRWGPYVLLGTPAARSACATCPSTRRASPTCAAPRRSRSSRSAAGRSRCSRRRRAERCARQPCWTNTQWLHSRAGVALPTSVKMMSRFSAPWGDLVETSPNCGKRVRRESTFVTRFRRAGHSNENRFAA